MPTYINRTGQLITPVNTPSIPPNQEIQLEEYISLDEYPQIEKINDNPPFKYEQTFTGIKDPTNLYEVIYHFSSPFVFIVKDNLPCSDGDIVRLSIYGGDTDDQSMFVSMEHHEFVHETSTDQTGNPFNDWGFFQYPSGNQNHPFKFITFRISKINVIGSVDLYFKRI